MDLLADENLHPAVVARLRSSGYRVAFIRETSPGSKDEDILARPDIGSLALLTYDRDFGDLIFNHGLPAPAPILYTRLNRAKPEVIAARLLTVLEAGVAAGHITTITNDADRLKPFPAGAANA